MLLLTNSLSILYPTTSFGSIPPSHLSIFFCPDAAWFEAQFSATCTPYTPINFKTMLLVKMSKLHFSQSTSFPHPANKIYFISHPASILTLIPNLCCITLTGTGKELQGEVRNKELNLTSPKWP